MIRPASRFPHLDVGELWHYRELLWTLVWRDVAVRYKQTFLGVAWAILVPAFTALVYVIVFGKFANFPAGTTPYPSLVVAGVLPMQYFASALSLASLSLLVEPPARHEGLLPADAAPARRRVRAARRLRRRPARARLPHLEVRHVALRLGDADGAALDPARGGDGARHQPAARRRQRPLPGRPLHDPRVPPGPAAPLGRDVRRRPDPREVAVDPLVQPDDLRDRGLALGRARRQPAQPGPGRRRRRRRAACCSSSGSPRSARRNRASRTRSDVDRDRGRLALEEVPPRRVPGGLRDAPRDARPRRATAHAAGAPSPGLGGLGAPRRLVRGSRGPGARHHRPQRRRQVDAAQDPHADRVRRPRDGPRSAAASAACSRSGRASTRSSPAARTSTSTARSSA